MKRSKTSKDLAKEEKGGGLAKSASAQNLPEQEQKQRQQEQSVVTLEQLILLHCDLQLLLPLLSSCIQSHLRILLPDLQVE